MEANKLKTNEINHDNYLNWWNSLDLNWKKLFFYNTKHSVSFENSWKSADYYAFEYDLEKFKPTIQFFKKTLQIEIFSCNLKYSTITSLNFLSHLENLIGINCHSTSVDDLEPVKHLLNIKYLDVHHSGVYDLTPIRNWNLEILNYQRNFDEDKDDLSKFTKLRNLNLRYGNLTDLGFMSNFSNLEYLNIAYTKTKSLRPLYELKSLQKIYMRDTQVPQSEINELKERNTKCEIETGLNPELSVIS